MADNNKETTSSSSHPSGQPQPQASSDNDEASNLTHSQGSQDQASSNANNDLQGSDNSGNNVTSTQNTSSSHASSSSQALQSSASASASQLPNTSADHGAAAAEFSEHDAVRQPLNQPYPDVPPPPYPGPQPPPYDQPAPPYPGPPQSHYQHEKSPYYHHQLPYQHHPTSQQGPHSGPQRVVTSQPSSSDEYGVFGGLMGSTDSSRPNSWITLSIITCLCFSPICGLFAICFSLMSHTAYGAGDVERARRNANLAVATSFLGISLSILAAILYFYAQR